MGGKINTTVWTITTIIIGLYAILQGEQLKRSESLRKADEKLIAAQRKLIDAQADKMVAQDMYTQTIEKALARLKELDKRRNHENLPIRPDNRD